ncbi:MAG: truD [Deltaproteobacteria bacterium]|nr:truD [Deltaproteobacteria bacterium]
MSTTGNTDMMYPYLTAAIPGIGGIFKDSAEDFAVTEIPLYPPCGSGEHVYATVEKKALTTLELLRRLARTLAVAERDIGYAGMKDARGITRQTVSIPGVSPEQVAALEIPGVTVVSVARHNNKLRLGHLAGNRFRIRLRGVRENARQLAQAALDIISSRGLPNYFGGQRYGVLGNSALIGIRLLQGDPEGAVRALIGNPEEIGDERWRSAVQAFHNGNLAAAVERMPPHCRTEKEVLKTLLRRPEGWERAVKSIHPRIINLYLSAAQSSLFDRTVAARIDALDRIEPGDIACKHANGACFLVTDAAEATARAASFEISATGPMFGRKMLIPAGQAAALEEEILETAGLPRDTFNGSGRFRLDGERRPLRVPLQDVTVAMDDGSLLLEFILPKGSYATSVLREIMK